MANLSVTAGSVLQSSGAALQTNIAGATITAGQAVYLDTVANTLKLAGCQIASIATFPLGIAVCGAATGQPCVWTAADASFTPGCTLSLSTAAAENVVILSATPGGIAPVADLASGDFPIIMGVAISTTKMILAPIKGTAALTA